MIHKFSRYLLTLVALFAMTAGAWAQEEYESFDLSSGNTNVNGTHFTITGTSGMNGYGLFLSGESVTVTSLNGENITRVEFIIRLGKSKAENITGTPGTNSCTNDNENGSITDINATSVTLSTENTGTTSVSIKQITVYYGNSEPAGPVVTISDDKTEASFDMPAFDATAEYELVRDMSVQMTTQVGDGNDGFRIRVKKNEQQQFEPAEMQFDAMLALFTVNDEIEEKTLTFYGQTVDCKLSIYAVDENGEPTGDAIAFADLEPGRYVAIATAAENSNYDGETGPSNIFELYQGYEVEIPAGEMITYYKDEAIYVEDEDVQLFSITAVGENTATATQYDVIPANKAMLVKNNSAEPKTVLLIPTETDPLSFTWYDGFVGTLEATTILASDATTDRYAFNGKQFVRVKNDLAVGANKAWLEIPAANNARIINISFEETTGIHGTNWANEANGTWYDLNGRKLDAVPTKKGVYILNGRKVVVK